MSIEQMRDAISKVHKSHWWKSKVANMPDNQVIAIYYSFLERGEFKEEAQIKREIKEQERIANEPIQLSIFDLI